MNRRDFLQTAAASAFSLAATMGATELRADEKKKDEPAGPPVNCAVIGLGDQGQAILASLAKMGSSKAPITTVCDSYKAPVFVKKSTAIAPTAAFMDDYRRVLDDKKIQAVFVATPSHKHKQIVLDALQAGKHVYCEAPLATDLSEAKDIAKAGMDAKTYLMPGLQVRSNAQAKHVGKFIAAKDFGKIVHARGQWHAHKTWRKSYPDDARQKELNWRLYKDSSSGLLGEIGIHQIDTFSLYNKSLPTAVTGFGGILVYKDGREVEDVAQCMVEYPNSINYMYDASLLSTYEGSYDIFCLTLATLLLRDLRAWLFKEAEAPTLGWEGYARRDVISAGDYAAGTGEKIGVGIALVADATKQLALGKDPGKVGTDLSRSALYQSLEAFVTSVSTNKKPDVTPLDGYQATVVSHKCNEAVTTKSRIVMQPEWFTL